MSAAAKRLSAWLVPAAALAATVPAAAAERPIMLLAGNARGVWLVRRIPAGFHVVVRPTGKSWEWIARDVPGEPALVAATESQAHVMMRGKSSGYLTFQMSTPGRRAILSPYPDDPRWPRETTPLAMCPAPEGFGRSKGPALVTVVPRPPPPAPAATKPTTRPAATRPAASTTTAAASAPASRPHPLHPAYLAVFNTVAPQWQFLVERKNVDLPRDSRVRLAVAGGTLYMLICPPAGPNRLDYWRPPEKPKDDKEAEGPPPPWRSLPLEGPPVRGHVVALLAVGERLTLLTAVPPKGKGADARRHVLQITTYEGPGKGFLHQVVTRGHEPLTWPADQPPLAAAMGDQCALLWTEDHKLEFATCPLHGQVVTVYDVRVFERPPLDTSGPAILQKFMWILVGAVFFGMFLLRGRTPARPLVLASHLVPAPLARRLAASLVDLMLVNMVAAVAFQFTLGHLSPDEARRMLDLMWRENQIPARAAYAIVIAAVSYVAYGAAMERRFGATLGKMLLRLRVVTLLGEAPALRGALLRNLVKLFELTFLPLLLVPLFSRVRLRLGDILARTIVVEQRSAEQRPPPPAEPGREDQDGPQPPGRP